MKKAIVISLVGSIQGFSRGSGRAAAAGRNGVRCLVSPDRDRFFRQFYAGFGRAGSTPALGTRRTI